MNYKLASEKVILSSPMSFNGSRVRIWKITDNDNVWLRWLLLVPLGLFFVLTAWCLVIVWYCVFSIWLVPWRLFRRGTRKDKKRELQHRELLEQMQKTQNN